MVLHQRVLWVGAIVATWQFLGCSKVSEQFEPTAIAIGTVAYQTTHRKVFQHSVIPGGVYSGAELARARRTDPVVARHYLDFGVDGRVSRLSRDELVYVSYRRGSKVFWTQRKHRVCAGEAVVRDAKGNLARSRCGNRLSKTPKLPTAETEPSEAALNAPEVEPAIGPGLSGAGPVLEAGNLPQAKAPVVGAFGSGDPIANQRDGPSDASASGAPVSTGAGNGNDVLGAPAGFYPSVAPYFGAGALAAPVLAAVSSGGGTTTTATNAGGTPTAVATTPEAGSLGLFVVGCFLVGLVRRGSRGLAPTSDTCKKTADCDG